MTDRLTLNQEDVLTGDDRILYRAQRRFTMAEKWEADFRRRSLDDIKFANADPDNGWQWLPKLRQSRELDDKPCLTLNKTRQHNLLITNDARQHKPSVKVRPVGSEASYKAAEIIEGIVRHIEYISKAQVAYDTATKFQVDGGIGYWRLITDYVRNDSFDQEIYIRRIPDPFAVYLDPDIQELDGSDARFGFIFEDMPRDRFNREYPQYKDMPANTTKFEAGGTWIDENHVRVAEYYERQLIKDTLVSHVDQATGQRKNVLLSEIPDETLRAAFLDAAKQEQTARVREVEKWQVMWYKIAGDKIIDRRPWIGMYVPIIRIVGEELKVEGKLDRKGHTRTQKDAQRMYNYWSSSATEQVALQTKTPYITPLKAIEGYETYWAQANIVNAAYLPYHHADDEGNPIPRPERAEPPAMASAYVEGMKIAQQELMMVSGQYEANFGAQSNERSGRAIDERQRQGDTATYHFIDNLAVGIRFTGVQILDLFPKVYDTARVIRILGKDGTQRMIQLDPEAKMAYQEKKNEITEEVQTIFNPNVGHYDVYADVGPAYATQRQEAYNALSQIMTQAPDLVNVAGDLLFRAADFPMADKLAERLERRVPADVKGEGPPPEVAMLQAQLSQANAAMEGLIQELAEQRLEIKNKSEQKNIDIYKAVTDRLGVLLKETVSPKDLMQLQGRLMQEDQRASQALETAATSAAQTEAQ